MGRTTNKFSSDARERAVRLVSDHQHEDPSRWAAITRIGPLWRLARAGARKSLNRAPEWILGTGIILVIFGVSESDLRAKTANIEPVAYKKLAKNIDMS